MKKKWCDLDSETHWNKQRGKLDIDIAVKQQGSFLYTSSHMCAIYFVLLIAKAHEIRLEIWFKLQFAYWRNQYFFLIYKSVKYT